MNDTIEGPKVKCCCGVHIHLATQIIMWIKIVWSTVLIVWQFPHNILVHFIGLFVSALLLYGLINRHPSLYIPYFIWPIVLFIYNNFIDRRKSRDMSIYYQLGGYALFLFLVLIIVFIVALIYFLYIVPGRSYKLLKYEKEVGKCDLCRPEYPKVVYKPTEGSVV